MKRVILYVISILVIFTLVFPMSISADKPVGVIRDFSFESNVITKFHEFNKLDNYGLDTFGIAESFSGDGNSGSKCVRLQASGRDYSNVYSKVKGPVDLDEIIEISFWYKHLPGSIDSTPYVVLWFELYDGGYLGAIQWNRQFLGPNYNWTLFNDDRWTYFVFDSNWTIIDGDWGPVLFSTIQSSFNGELLKNEASVGIAAGFDGWGCDVLVDDLTITLQGNLRKVKK